MKRMILGLCGLLGVAVAGCDEADKIFDCQSVCDRYKSCFNNSYDVGACRDRCKSKADADKDFEKKADACESCIDDRSCTSATFNCATECASIVP
ncbi:MAG: hypothetical protein SF187_25840 [Deltaproteobacteria bacterium]|nr:hypothetical protein [Deltaproteobacteria bacterium]